MGLVLVILLQTSNRNIQPQTVLDNIFSDIDLALTTINNNQIWRGQAIAHDATVATVNNLAHTGIVIRTNNGLDFKLAIVFLARFPVNEDNHGCHRTGPLNIGVIKGLNPPRSRNVEQLPQIFNGSLGFFEVFFKQVKFLLQADPSIFSGQIDQLLLLTPLGFKDLGLDNRLSQLGINILWNEDLLGQEVLTLLIKLP